MANEEEAERPGHADPDSDQSGDRQATDSDSKDAKGNDKKPDKPSPLKRPGVRLGLFIGLAVLLVGLACWFSYYELRGKYYESTNDAYIRADSVAISSKVGGYVQEVLVADNQEVKGDQPLVKIDERDYQAQVAQYQAQIDVAKASADGVRANILEQEATVTQARAQLGSAKSDAVFSAGEVSRYAPLAQTGAETGERLSTLRNQARQSSNQVTAQSAALTSAERHILSLRAQVQQAEAQGEAARAQLQSATTNLGYATIRASVDGRVGDRTVRVGQYVQPGMRLMTVVPVNQMYITANFKETQIGLMRTGQPVTIKVDALPGTPIRGHVESLSPGTGAEFSLIPPQNATGNFTKIVQRVPVRIAIDAGPQARRVLVPGLSVVVDVDTISAKEDAKSIRQEQKNVAKAGP
jgi:membrane fusion protein (multidrug efflux system)